MTVLIIQGVVIVVALSIVISVLAGRQTHAARAWKKVALCLLAFAMIIAVLFPDTTNVLAHAVGVGRGADLLLYLVTLAFIGYVVNNYVHQQKDKDVLYKLARKVALSEARLRNAKRD